MLLSLVEEDRQLNKPWMSQIRKVSVGLFQHVRDVLKGMVVAAFLAAFLCREHLVHTQLEDGDVLSLSG